MKKIQYTLEMQNKVSKITLNPYWIAGLTAGEGCFSIGISPDSTYKLGSRVKLNFSIGLTNSNQELQWAIWLYFNKTGGVHKGGRNMARYQVGSLKDTLETIIPFFDQYPILGEKNLDFINNKEVAYLMKNNEHLTETGLKRCFEFKFNTNTFRANS